MARTLAPESGATIVDVRLPWSKDPLGQDGKRVSVALLAATVLSLAILGLRMLLQGDATYGFLAWNLFLAWIPLLLAAAVVTTWKAGGRITTAPLLVFWLLFFPNAPYVVTDFVHLGRIGGMPDWFDALLLGTFAATSLAIAFVSLHLIQNLLRDISGSIWSWAGALAAIALAGVGIYLGRVYQLNSWDIVQPQRLHTALSAADTSAHEHGAWLTLILTCFLAAAYATGHRLAEISERGCAR
jgi:uncharacterized membrane protein